MTHDEKCAEMRARHRKPKVKNLSLKDYKANPRPQRVKPNEPKVKLADFTDAELTKACKIAARNATNPSLSAALLEAAQRFQVK